MDDESTAARNSDFRWHGEVKGILYAVGGAKRVPAEPDTLGCGGAFCYKIVEDLITYAFKAVP